jgi:drug/metabolite transporter (DMT)-like permease
MARGWRGWLLRNAPISQVVTHQYVNPLVAIALGSLLLGESLDATTAVGAVIVIGAVFATVRSESRQAARVAVAQSRPAIPAARAK